MAIDKDFIVRAGQSRYPVLFGSGKKQISTLTSNASKIVIISNPTVFALHGESFIKNRLPGNKEIHSIIMGDGEKYKNVRTVNMFYDHFFDIGLGRRDMIVALGGGVVGDTAGFAASTFKRGTGFIQAPTTVLAMVDSSIGGKVGINHALGKNLIGAFYHPKAVLVNPSWLSTLGKREMIGGIAEIIKAGFLNSQTFLREAISFNIDDTPHSNELLLKLIIKSMRFKARIVARDANDDNVRRILNFGHTFGHAIEKVEGFGKYTHGEAVIAGMIGALHLSHATKNLSHAVMRESLTTLLPYLSHLKPLKNKADAYLSPMRVDKKTENGKLIFILLKGIGKPIATVVNSKNRIIDSIEFMKEFVNSNCQK